MEIPRIYDSLLIMTFYTATVNLPLSQTICGKSGKENPGNFVFSGFVVK